MARIPEFSSSATRSELFETLSAYRKAFFGVAAVSGVLNVLMLTGSFFMLLVYDVVLPSRSGPTLTGLLILVLLLYGFQGVLDFLRARILVQVAGAVDVASSPRVYALVSRVGVGGRTAGDGLQPLRDLDQLRAFLSGSGPLAFFDLPWMLLYLGICFAFHVAIGVTAMIGAILLIGLAIVTDRMTRAPVSKTVQLASLRNGLAETNRQNAEVLRALGMRSRMQASWSKVNLDYLRSQQEASTVSGSLGSITKITRVALQSVILAVGAWLVLQNKATGGVIIASSILTSRALAPIELAIANWRSFVSARQSWARLTELMKANPVVAEPTPLPAPHKSLSVEQLSLAPPGADRLTVQDVTFALKAGDGLGVVGPSAAGKSSLIRGIVGAWPPIRGKVRLDGGALDQWDDNLLGRYIGYLPQDVELLAGTVAENIARFDPEAAPEEIYAAAGRARAHELILRLPDGYETQVGPQGRRLSAGQAQRVGLARALYGEPFLVVLDEPDSNLDPDGERALIEATAEVRARGGIVIVVAHRPSALAAADRVLVMNQGRLVEFGAKDEILPKILPQPNVRPVDFRGRA